jgi:TRAP-type C4-dicarboxylate transport system permease small subunit
MFASGHRQGRESATGGTRRATGTKGALKMNVMSILRWLDRNIEKFVILICYATMAGIICEEVFRRFVLKQQAPWSTTIPIYLFLWITWIGAAYNTKLRTHLSFDEIRMRLPYKGQFACQCLDAALWIVFGLIVFVYTSKQVMLSHDNFAIVQGTDNVMQWWFYLATPLGWGLLMIRALQNLWLDIKAFREGKPFQISVALIQD